MSGKMARGFVKLLIADGSLAIIERLKSMLGECPEIEFLAHATDAGTTVRSIEAGRPDLVILDPRLAGGDGLGWLAAIRKMAPSLVIVVFTNLVYGPYPRYCLTAGANLFFDKSNEFDSLIARVHSLAQSPEAVRETTNQGPQ